MSVTLPAIDPFLRLIDRLIDLVQRRNEAERAWLRDVVEPIFARFEPVAKSYIDFFRKARDLTSQESSSTPAAERFATAVDQLSRHRESTLEARRVVQAFASASLGTAPADVSAFLGLVREFFYSTGIIRQGSHSLMLLDVFEAIAAGKVPEGGEWFRAFPKEDWGDPLDDAHLNRILVQAVNNLEYAWDAVVHSYAEIRVSLPK